jgi:hypothetical protein
VSETEACLNCGAILIGPYCAECGQKKAHTDLTLREFFHETTHELTQWDGRLAQTLKALFLKPGRLTIDFLAGRQARWLAPLRLYLICSVVYFVSEPLVESITHRSAREMARITVTDSAGAPVLTPDIRKSIEESLPARIFGAARIERAVANSDQLNRAFRSAYPKAMFVLLPVFALLTSIAWRRPEYRYPAHLYTALHLHAAWFGALAVVTLLSVLPLPNAVATGLEVVAVAYCAAYALIALHNIFGGSWAVTVGKTAAVTVVYLGVLGVVSLLLLAYALMTM